MLILAFVLICLAPLAALFAAGLAEWHARRQYQKRAPRFKVFDGGKQ